MLEEEKYEVNVDKYAEFLRFKKGKSNIAYELSNKKSNRINDGPRATVRLNELRINFWWTQGHQ